MQLNDKGIVDIDFTIDWSNRGITKHVGVHNDDGQTYGSSGTGEDGDNYLNAFDVTNGSTNLDRLLNEVAKLAGAGAGNGNSNGNGGNGQNGRGGGGGGDCQCEDCCPELTEQVLEAVSERVDTVVNETMLTAGIEAEAKVTEAVKADVTAKVDLADAPGSGFG